MSLADDLDAPIPVTVGDATYKLGVLDIDDYGDIDAEVIAAKVAAEVAKLPNTHTAADIREVRSRFGGMTIEGLGAHIFAPGGAVPFLARQLVKGGSAATLDEGREIARKIGRALGWRDAAYLAGDASGIFPSRAEVDRRRAEAEAKKANGETSGPNR